MQTVKQVIEDLQRFNPEARIEEEVEVSGASPAVSCLIAVVGNETLTGELERITGERDDVLEKIDSLRDALSNVKESLYEKKYDEALKLVKEALE